MKIALKLAKLFNFYEKRSKIEFNKGERILSANALKVFLFFVALKRTVFEELMFNDVKAI